MKKLNKPIFIITILISCILFVFFLIKSNELQDDLLRYKALTTSSSANYLKYYKQLEDTEEAIKSNNILPIISICILGGGILLSYFTKGFDKVVDNIDKGSNFNNKNSLKELKSMLDEDLITKNEYEKKKQELLNKM